MTGTCVTCGRYFLIEHECKGLDVNIIKLKKVLLEDESEDSKILVASNGVFYSSSTYYLQLKNDVGLHYGVYDLHLLGLQKPKLLTPFPVAPTLKNTKEFTIDWKVNLMQLDLPFKALKVLLWLLTIYDVPRRIEFSLTEDYAMFNGKYFKMIMKVETNE